MKKSVPFAAIVLIALGIAVVNIHPPTVLFGIFVLYGLSGYALYAWRKAKGQHSSVISTSTDEPDERGLHRCRPRSSAACATLQGMNMFALTLLLPPHGRRP